MSSVPLTKLIGVVPFPASIPLPPLEPPPDLCSMLIELVRLLEVPNLIIGALKLMLGRFGGGTKPGSPGRAGRLDCDIPGTPGGASPGTPGGAGIPGGGGTPGAPTPGGRLTPGGKPKPLTMPGVIGGRNGSVGPVVSLWFA